MANKRKQSRVAIRHVGAIYADGTLLGECTVLDVSVGGARLMLKQQTEVPLQFTLFMSRGGSVQRRCQTVWQTEKEAGVRFIEE